MNYYNNVDTVSLNTEDGGMATYISQHLIQNQEQADWNETDITSPSYIKNKPTIFESENELPEVSISDEGKVLGVNKQGEWDLVEVEATGAANLPTIDPAQDEGKVLGVVNGEWDKMTASLSGGVNADYAENDETAPGFIKNRPFYIENQSEEYIFSVKGYPTASILLGGTIYGKLFDSTPTLDQYLNSKFIINSATIGAVDMELKPAAEHIELIDKQLLFDNYNGMLVAYVSGDIIIDESLTISVPEPGIYFAGASENQIPQDASVKFLIENIHQLENKYLSILFDKIENLELYYQSSGPFSWIDMLGAYAYFYNIDATEELISMWNNFTTAEISYGDIDPETNSVVNYKLYKLSPQNISFNGVSYRAVGNASVFGGTGEEPFLLVGGDVNFDGGFSFVVVDMVNTSKIETPPAHLINISMLKNEQGLKVKPSFLDIDWEQSDETKGPVIKNKPFYSAYQVITEGVFQDTKQDSDGDGIADTWEGELVTLDPSDANLEVGNFYDVEFNGVKYTGLECFVLEGIIPCIGNGMYLGGAGDFNCPFIIMRDVDGLMMGAPVWAAMIMNDSAITEDGVYSYKISGDATKYLNNKYLSFITSWNEQEILPAQQLQFSLEFENPSSPSESLYLYNASTNETIFSALNKLQVDRTYSITLDGYPISGRAKDISYLMPSGATIFKALAIGNLSILQNTLENTGEPYLIVAQDVYHNGSQTMYGIALQSSPDSDTLDVQFGITQQAGGVIKDSYLPSNLGGTNGNDSSLPSVSASDNDKVLTVVNGSWAAAKAPSGLPDATSSDAGKALMVDSSGAAQWSEIDALPARTVEDAGKCLVVNEDGNSVSWASSLPTVTVEDAGKFLRVSAEGAWVVEMIPAAEEAYF